MATKKKHMYSLDHTYLDNLAPAGSSATVCGPGAEVQPDAHAKQRPQSARSPPRKNRFLPLANSLGYGTRHKNHYVYTGQQWARPADPTAPVAYNAMTRPDAIRLARESFARYENMGWEKPAKGGSIHHAVRPQPPAIPDGWFKAQAAPAAARAPVQPASAREAAPASAPAPAPAPAVTLYSTSYGTGVAPSTAQSYYSGQLGRGRPDAQPPVKARRPVSAKSARRERVGFTPWLGRATPIENINYAAPDLYNTHMTRKARPQSAFVRKSAQKGHDAIYY